MDLAFNIEKSRNLKHVDMCMENIKGRRHIIRGMWLGKLFGKKYRVGVKKRKSMIRR